MEIELISGVLATPLIIGLVEAIKRATGMNEKFAPILAVVLGLVLFAGLFFAGQYELLPAIIMGIATGLAAVGLYSGVKNVSEGIKQT